MQPPTQESLRDGLGQSGQSAQFKAISQLDVHCENVLAVSPSAVVATASANGSCDAGPRGGPPGFIRALSPTRVAIGELPGNRLFDGAQNIAENPSAALLVMIPGVNEPLLIEGRAQRIHQDVDGEMLNNSFAAIAPSGRWFVGSEWDQVSRPLVYTTPASIPQHETAVGTCP